MLKSMLVVAATAFLLLACGEKTTVVAPETEKSEKAETPAVLPRALYYTISEA